MNCFGAADSCTLCRDKLINFRTLGVNSCNCDVGYYDDGSSFDCKACDSRCKSCITVPTNCTSCPDVAPITRGLINNECPCIIGYFEVLATCMQCDKTCLTCSTTSTNCETCDTASNRI